MEIHHVQRITHLLLMHEHVATSWILLVDHHIVNAHLALPTTLLRSHGHVIRLIHCVLMSCGLMMTSYLACLSLCVLCLRIWIFHDFMHVDFVANRWWWLWILLSVTIATMIVQIVCILHSRQLVALTVVNVVLATTWGCATWIRINTTNTIVRIICVLSTDHFIDTSARLHVVWVTTTFILSNINCASIVATFTQSAAFGACTAVPNVNILCYCISFETTLRLDRC